MIITILITIVAVILLYYFYPSYSLASLMTMQQWLLLELF